MIIILVSVKDTQDETVVSTYTGVKAEFLNDNATTQTLAGSVTSMTATRKNRTWLSFDGVDDRVDTGTAFPIQYYHENMTWSIWINITEDDGIDKRIIYTRSAGHGALKLNTTTSLYVAWKNNSDSFFNASYSTPINDSAWHHIVVLSNNTGGNNHNISLYVDGSLAEETNVFEGKVAAGYNRFTLFGDGGITYPTGKSDEFRYYNRTLTTGEISEIYNSSRNTNHSLPTKGLVLWLPLNENAGTNAHSFNQSLQSTTLASSILGATWENDGINITLTANTNYNLSGNIFTLIDINLAWSNLSLSYDARNISIENDLRDTQRNITGGVERLFKDTTTWFSLLSIVIIITIIGLVIFAISRFSSPSAAIEKEGLT